MIWHSLEGNQEKCRLRWPALQPRLRIQATCIAPRTLSRLEFPASTNLNTYIAYTWRRYISSLACSKAVQFEYRSGLYRLSHTEIIVPEIPVICRHGRNIQAKLCCVWCPRRLTTQWRHIRRHEKWEAKGKLVTSTVSKCQMLLTSRVKSGHDT